MLSDYDKICIQGIASQIGLSTQKVQRFYEKNHKNVEDTLREIQEKINNGSIDYIGAKGGVVYGNIGNSSTIYGMDKFNTPRGHGFAAERINHLFDKITTADFTGKVNLVGEDIDPQTGKIIKNGADRIVNGVQIQTKYCATGAKCIAECFEGGKFRYIGVDGKPMKIEVPSDKYESAVSAMETRIRRGEVQGVSDPKQAEKIVKKGSFTYEQAKNVAKFGTVESIIFDAVNGAIISTNAMGISAALVFAMSIWNGEKFEIAVKNAAYEGIKVGGVTFVTAILSSQLARTGINSMLVGTSDTLVKLMGPKASAALVNAFRSGNNIYGAAAMKSTSKMLRGNMITGTISVVVLSSADIVDIFRGRISGAQLFKNITNTATTVAGGSIGWVGGTTIGLIVPGVGSVMGGIVGSIVGGSVSGKVSKKILNNFIEDDAEKMVVIIQKVFEQLAFDYLLNKEEAEHIVDKLKEKLTGGVLKDMFASNSKEEFAYQLLIEDVESEVRLRKRISLPSDSIMMKEIQLILERMQ